MTQQAESTDVVQIALTTAFAHREDMVSVPKTPPAGHRLHAVEAKSCSPRWSAGAFESGIHGPGIDLADGTTSSIAGKNLIAKVTWISAKTPLMDAIIAAEGTTAFRKDLKFAPAAQR